MRRLAILTYCAALSACMTTRPVLPPAPWQQRSGDLQHLRAWQLDARAAVALTQPGGPPGTAGAAGTQGWQASMSWREKNAAAEVHLSGPFGVGALVLAQTPQGLSLNGAAPSDAVMAQIQDRLGFAPPLDSLGFWLLGVPDPGAAFELVRNAADRAQRLTQAGWTVDYDRYMPVNGDVLPAHVVLSREGIRVRIVVDHWSGLK
jgi:outer membrane lipoprotein LolB